MNTHDTLHEVAVPAGMLFDLGEAKPLGDSSGDSGRKEVAGGRREPSAAAPRLRYAERHQGEYRMVALDQWLPPEHEVRAVWDHVCQLDLTPLLAQIEAVAGKPGRDATDPRILLCLWLYATLRGVGSARQLDELCKIHLAYMWVCGGVTVNYGLLSQFRREHTDMLERLLILGVAALRSEGLVELNRVAQDGMRVRASAGAGSFRRRGKLETYLEEAQEQVQLLRAELDADPAASSRREQAAQKRAARERVERLQHALEELVQVEAAREAREKGSGKEARASMTDPEARRMKMADGGIRPGYNAQLATDTDSRIIVGVEITNAVSDSGQMGPMLDRIDEQQGKTPHEYLVDGGFATQQDITYAAREHGVVIYAPLKEEEKQREAGKDPYAPKKGDSPEVAQWRARMGTEQAKKLYRLRAATAEWTNAQARNRDFYQVTVRGLAKVKAVLLLYALVHNWVQGESLRAARLAAATAAHEPAKEEAANR